ncbi:MAG TPA: cyclic nucleotide-binding domain-containing protein, partial [Longimicrobiales bacterium]
MSPDEAPDFLRRLPLFAALGEKALQEVAQRTVARNAAAGTHLFRQGEPCKGLYIVGAGRVTVYRSSPDGREQVIHTQETG